MSCGLRPFTKTAVDETIDARSFIRGVDRFVATGLCGRTSGDSLPAMGLEGPVSTFADLIFRQRDATQAFSGPIADLQNALSRKGGPDDSGFWFAAENSTSCVGADLVILAV